MTKQRDSEDKKNMYPCFMCSSSNCGPYQLDPRHMGEKIGKIVVVCSEKDCKTVGPERPTEDEAITAWNNIFMEYNPELKKKRKTKEKQPEAETTKAAVPQTHNKEQNKGKNE